MFSEQLSHNPKGQIKQYSTRGQVLAVTTNICKITKQKQFALHLSYAQNS